MSVASFIASQRADYGVPHAKCCRVPRGLGVLVLQVARPPADASPAAEGGAR